MIANGFYRVLIKTSLPGIYFQFGGGFNGVAILEFPIYLADSAEDITKYYSYVYKGFPVKYSALEKFLERCCEYVGDLKFENLCLSKRNKKNQLELFL